MFTINDILELAIRLEKNGEKVYRDAIEHVDNEVFKNLLVWTVEEEERHAKWFTTLKNRIEKGEDHHILSEMSRSLIDDFVGDQSFSLKDVDFANVQTLEDLVKVFIEFENDTILFYDMLKSFISDDDTIESINQIIGEEKDHIEKFKALLPTITD